MSFPVTEIAYTVLKPGLKLDSASAAQVMDETLRGVREQEGCIRCYYGQTKQDEDLLMFFVGMSTFSFNIIILSFSATI